MPLLRNKKFVVGYFLSFVVRSISSFAPVSPHVRKASRLMSASTLDQEITDWCKSSGSGEVNSIDWAGSSDWASFRKVSLNNQSGPAYFVKTSSRSAKEMFEGEALGLQAMYECSRQGAKDADDVLAIPKVEYWGDYSGGSLLIMEFLSLGGRGDGYSLGKAMARMHLAEPNKENGNPNQAFGFALDNTIGGTPQPNPWTQGGTTKDWIEFYRDHRIGHQLQLAGDSYCSKLWDKDIAPRLDALFEGIDVRPSLLHGDLWSGNIGTANGKPSIYDPATYWGHHEAEWGMSWCASFGSDFWEGYRSLIPKDPGFEDRKPLYDAYHQLNHYNLFGGSYLGSAQRQLEQLKRILDKK